MVQAPPEPGVNQKALHRSFLGFSAAHHLPVVGVPLGICYATYSLLWTPSFCNLFKTKWLSTYVTNAATHIRMYSCILGNCSLKCIWEFFFFFFYFAGLATHPCSIVFRHIKGKGSNDFYWYKQKITWQPWRNREKPLHYCNVEMVGICALIFQSVT